MATLGFPVDGSDFYYEFSLTNPDGTARVGLQDVACYLSDTEAGPIITGLTNVGAVETATPGTYGVTFDGVDLKAYLTDARVGRGGAIVTVEGSKLLASDPIRFTKAPRPTS